MSRRDSYSIEFNPKSGGIRVAKPYNGERHNDPWQTVTLCNGLITLNQYEDGEFIALELHVAGAGLELSVWPTTSTERMQEAAE